METKEISKLAQEVIVFLERKKNLNGTEVMLVLALAQQAYLGVQASNWTLERDREDD